MKNSFCAFLHIRWTNFKKEMDIYAAEVLQRAAEHAECFPEVEVRQENNGNVPVRMRKLSEDVFFLQGRLFRNVGGVGAPYMPLVRSDGPLQNAARGEHQKLWEVLFRHDCKVPDPATQPL